MSHNVARVLATHGYTNVKVFAGGIPSWKRIGMPLFGSESSAGSFDISGGKPDRKVTAAEFARLVREGTNIYVLDVRNDQERSSGFILGSIHIPDTAIHADPNAIAHKLPKDKNATILIHCATGARAAGVVEKIVELGYPNTLYLDNRIMINQNGEFSF